MKLVAHISLILSFILITTSLFAEQDLYDEDIEDILSLSSELKADVGSRSGARNYLDSNTPVDVITSEQIEHSGLTSLVDILRYFVAGFNAPETSVADGSDHVRAYTLRGMSPDQILVLINGKRLHTSAMLHVNGVIGRGSSHVDLNTIAVRSIAKVEILRDGAAAQYGSDAISGVINIILKGMGHQSSASIHIGQRKDGDGEVIQADAFVNIALDYDGFINLTLDASQQNQTQRAGVDNRLTPPTIETHVGIPDAQNFKAILNVEVPQESDINFYTQGLLNYRDSEASAFFRPPSDKSAPLYEDGFLPKIKANILDYSVTLGIKGELSDNLSWDLSNSIGENKFHYFVDNSMNYSLAEASPKTFNNGRLNFLQNTTTLDLKQSHDDFSIAGGLEYRYERYSIQAGENASYTGTGSQGFAGFALENEVDNDRYSYAFYVDSVYNFTKNFIFEVALRYENYSDFGDSTNGKIALSYKIMPQLMFRSSASTGFRAPSLAQSNYSQTSSFVDSNGNLSTQGTFRTDHEVAMSMGAQDLTSEKSKHFTLGSVFQPTNNISLTLDYFYIDVEDKIILTPEISPKTQQQKDIFDKYNVSAARFFTNAASMNTQGIDIKLNHKHIFSSYSKLDLSLWYNYNVNTLEPKIKDTLTPQNLEIITMIEEGQPKDAVRFLTNYEYQKFNTTFNISRYGEYKQMRDSENYTFDAAWTADLDITYSINKSFKIALGGINIFDSIPNKWDGLSGNYYGENGIKPYSRYSPFGYSGAYYYIRGSMEF